MCSPALAGMAALSLAGTALSAYQQRQYQKSAAEASEDQARAELERQRGFQDESGEQFANTLNRFAMPAQTEALDEAAGQRQEAIESNIAEDFAVPLSGSTPDVVRSEIAKRMADAVGRGRQQAQALGRIGARGDVGLGNQVAIGRGNQNLGDIASFSRGSLNLLPGAQRAAVNNVPQPSGIGDLFAGAGRLGLDYGLSGGFGGQQSPSMFDLQRKTKGYGGGIGF